MTEIEKRRIEISRKMQNVKGEKCEVYSRIVGYHRPVENWNVGKKDEFANRYTYEKDINK